MRTTLDIDDQLLQALLARLPQASKTEAIETAISSFVGRDAVRNLAEMAGTVEIEDLSQALRENDRRT
ncbi:MAG: type II toxin-antitoxin system VapB family antitoxin [Solirubrobacterales bacterium]